MITIALAWLLSASGAFAHGDLHEQILSVTEQLTKHPKDAQLYFKRAELHRAHGEFPDALADLDQAARLNPKLDAVDLARGKTCVEARQPALATNALTRFLAKHPDHADAWLTRGRAFALLGQGRAAAADFTQAITRAQNASPDLYLERARALSASGGELVEEALHGLEEGLRKLGPLVTLELAAIDLELKLKRHDAALHRVDRITEQMPRKETWFARSAEILELAGRPAEARTAWRKALQALEALPERLRTLKATTQLESKIRLALADDKP